MKKFTSFLCALFIAMSASAEVIDLTILDHPYVSSNDYGTPQVYISMTAEENYGITIYINGTLELVNGQTYTYADMDSWSSIGNYNTYQYSSLSDAAITWTKDAEGLERFEGFVNDTLGNTYNFLYQEKKFAPTGDTIQVRFSKVGSFEYSTWSGYWNVSGYDNYGSGNPYSVYFALNTGSDSIVTGHFTEADFAEPDYNHIYVNQEGKPSKDYKFRTADITIIERNDSLLCYAYALADDGNVYDIFIYYSDPKPIYHRNINISSMTVDTTGLQWGSVSFKGANAEFEVNISAWLPTGAEDYHGTYKYGDCYPSIYDAIDSVYVSLFSGEFTVTKGENGDIVTGTFLGWNDTEYEIYMTEGMPEKTREEVIAIENAGLYIYEDLHKFIIWGCNEDSSRVVSVSIKHDTIQGNYTINDIEVEQSYVAYDMNEQGRVSDVFKFLNAEIAVAYDAETGEAILAGTILAQSDYHASDVPEFTLYLKAQPAHPHLDYDTDNADLETEFEDYVLEPYYEDGYVIVKAQNDTVQAAIAFILAEGDTTFTAGTYECSLKGEPMTVYTGSCDGMYVYVSFFMDNKYNLWFPFAGTATVSEEGVIVFDALNSYDRTIKVTFNKSTQGVENTEVTRELNKRLENDMIIIEKNGVQYNVLGTKIK